MLKAALADPRTPRLPSQARRNTRASRIGHLSWKTLAALVLAFLSIGFAGCGSGGGPSGALITVNSAEDPLQPAAGVTTLRAAMDGASSGDKIAFDPSLDGSTILLSTAATDHAVLKGEIYSGMTFQGYQDRDYGRSALYAHKNLTIDASALTHGITIKWNGGDSNRARVLAVYGDLTLKNVTITGGHSSADVITGGAQPYTLARGGGLAVWGTLTLDRCTIAGNRCTGDTASSRDRGTYGGGIYANGLNLTDSVISGNAAIGYGAAGGGIYSVGGADNAEGKGNDTRLERCAITGNRVTAQHAYGGGVFTLSGGPNNLAAMRLTNCTVARNMAEDNPALPQAGQWYTRGGGIYMGGGSLSVVSCTIAENEVNGVPATFSGKPNLGGGGVAATIGNAHTVEDVTVRHSIVVGNKLNGTANDWFAGSLLNFASGGYNLMGVVDFSQILVPVPDWMNLSRKHYPKAGDVDGITLAQALNVGGVQRHGSALSAGTDAGQPAILWYPPAGLALDRVPSQSYSVSYVLAGYVGFGVSSDDFLNQVILKLRANYGSTLGSDFGSSIGDMSGVTWYESPKTWPSDPANAPWIAFWQNLDALIAGRLGTASLGDDFWGTFESGPLGSHVSITVQKSRSAFGLTTSDQRGRSRPSGSAGDSGAVEL